ncbi:MAG: hypothetical protein JXB46_11115, partial [Candidatus Eisenbacteria bacterium]|nr:hypothetical protein [Candidatus Eisenbacteria bacterium]
TEPKSGWVSPGFGERTPAPAVVSGGEIELPVTLVSVVLPRAGALEEIQVSCPGGAGESGLELNVAFSEGSDWVAMGSPPSTSYDTFSGTLGFVAERSGVIERTGIGIDEWSDAGGRVDFEEAPNLLFDTTRRAGPSI